ncbi:UrcA family protein [Erythrobacter rubeus]|uniref:UrcA family protein n=1 Tax=Erythrobacter rubeus TaxID=2760803 RepID=A0ABR8KM04_9SPHN|nr:UrcA family protein [Erythrobacter rubeus]MBD2841523.1 UrcA family protein [Erythrobacter rubeus]
MFTTLKLCFAACTFAVVTAPAAAEDVSIAVYFGDLNLSDERGLAMLENRLEKAIKGVCGRNASRSIANQVHASRCERNLRRQAKKTVAAITNGRTKFAGDIEIAYRG